MRDVIKAGVQGYIHRADNSITPMGALMEAWRVRRPFAYAFLWIFGVRAVPAPTLEEIHWFLYLVSNLEGRPLSRDAALQLAAASYDSIDLGEFEARLTRRLLPRRRDRRMLDGDSPVEYLPRDARPIRNPRSREVLLPFARRIVYG